MALWKNLSLLSLITLLTSLATLISLHQTSTKYQESPSIKTSSYHRSSRSSIEQRLNLTSTTKTLLPTRKLSTRHPEVSVTAAGEALEKNDNTQQPKPARRGYVLAEDYWEQQTSGSRNLQSLQCWAGQLNLSVVEPFTVNSVLQTPLSINHDSEMLRFGDLFDLQSWNKNSKNFNHSQLVSWEDFLHHAPRDVILVRFKYVYPHAVKEMRNLVKQGLRKYPIPSERYKINCSTTGWPKETHTEFLTSNHFEIVRQVCFNFDYGDRLLPQDFIDHIYGPYAPENATVIFRQWRSIGASPRILLKNPECHNTFVQVYIHPSRKLLQHAKTYQEAYLKGSAYIAIMARLEKSAILLQKPKKDVVADCLAWILRYWNRTVVAREIGSTFLSIDLGRFGSNSFHSDSNDVLETFLKRLYGNATSISKWEKTFEDISHTTDSGYIALLQKTLVVQANCVIFSGGGSFQQHALHLYQEMHPKDQCIAVVDECTGGGFFPH